MFILQEKTWVEVLEKFEWRFPQLDFSKLYRVVETEKAEKEIANRLVLAALEQMSQTEPDWTFVAARCYLEELYQNVAKVRGLKSEAPYEDFYGLIQFLTERKIYRTQILESYSEAEIAELQSVICREKDELYTYIGLKTLADRYLAKLHDGTIVELPQERLMMIAMTLMQQENKEKRLSLVKEAYWAMSNLYMTVATPTLANSGKAVGQLSSCFVDTIDDSLRGIFDSITDAATVSKNGGGLGIYLGKIRAKGSTIKRFENASSGVLPWMKQLNNVAVSVDQLGQRQGAIAVYLDVWHKDIFAFLDAKLNNGDERQRTHDLFTAVCIPDIFMEAVEKREDWYLFDPHEVREVMGFSLEDVYDENKTTGRFRTLYEQCVQEERLSKEMVPAIEIMKRIMLSQLETGAPFMFYRDTANRLNPNHHAGMVYGSNLCTEITQNMSSTTVIEEKTADGKIMITKEPGDYVVCNLSSLSLARVLRDNVLARVIQIQVRMLDNVIDLNAIEVPQAELTNQKYRAIGLGTFGWHHYLATEKVDWESEKAVELADSIYEKINYLTIKASAELAKEKGAYPTFNGSDWETGSYFEKRGYESSEWNHLAETVKKYGIRNGYLLAVAPNATTSLIGGSSASIDPIFAKEYMEEKKNYRIPVTAPDLSAETTWYYKPAHLLDQSWSIKQNAARQRHIDQSISFNIYVSNTIRAKALLDLHVLAWKEGLKTTYYVRSTSHELEEDCESCSS